MALRNPLIAIGALLAELPSADSLLANFTAITLAIRNAAGTFTSSIVSIATVNRTVTIPDRSFTVAGTDDLPIAATKTVGGLIVAGAQEMPSGQKTFNGSGITSATKSIITKNLAGVETFSVDDAGTITATSVKTIKNLFALNGFIANYDGSFGNYNFEMFTTDYEYTIPGASVSFLVPSQDANYLVYFPTNSINIPSNFLIRLRFYIISGDINGANHNSSMSQYISIIPYDSDGNIIGDWMSERYSNSAKTTLASDLNNGDTSMTLTSSSGWAGAGTVWYERQISWWPWIPEKLIYGYKEASGKINLPYTYTRNVKQGLYDGLWTPTGISGNVVTFNPAMLPGGWNGGYIPAGTPIQNSYGGGASIFINTSPVSIGDTFFDRTFTVNKALTANHYLYNGSVKIKLLGRFNYVGTGIGSKVRLSPIYITLN